ncbi:MULTISPECIES: low molecular weight protein-tyrosine-phosphatase [unclassified Streptococcus]|uniref:low molecular weight protein-tyrosine-phosphatase n=1 Tax=unclassified Streptococcus TaxID=2608887 RepID=UPI002A858D60|nr:low molecular weight phosphotyrosine protein phosphatase [Streptococcus sp.]MDY3824890.1 low molecular weight protein-tyrosine-phosphatase [Streptococcus sp.]
MKVCFVCLGNICRSPMAEFVMKDIAKGTDWQVESRATSSWEHGNPIHRGTQAILNNYHIAYDHTKGSQEISLDDLKTFDLILGMDEQNVADLLSLSAGEFDHKIHLFGEVGVPDPYYTGDFEETYALVTKGCQAWFEKANGD